MTKIGGFWKKKYVFPVLIILFFFCPLISYGVEPRVTYLIGPEDILEISVWKDPDLSKQVVVRSDGRISFPLVGEVDVGGHTVDWLQKQVTKQIHEFVPDAMVTVMMIQTNSMKIYVVGKVARPGEYKIGKRINVMQALALAGGLDRFADEDDILILRYVDGKHAKTHFNYGRLKKGKDIEQNIQLRNGDVVVVP